MHVQKDSKIENKNSIGQIDSKFIVLLIINILLLITGCLIEACAAIMVLAPIPYLCDLLQRILPLRPLRDCGFTEADFKSFPLSVEANQQRLMTNAYYPFDLESEEAIYRECF